jgi:hypothetical protein
MTVMRFLSPSADDIRGPPAQVYGEKVIREDTPASNPGRKAAFGLAVNMFVEEPRLDLDLIEEELGLPATTVGAGGRREVLLAEVLDHFADLAFNRAEAEAVIYAGPRQGAGGRPHLHQA